MQSQQLPTKSQVFEDEVLAGTESAGYPAEEMSERHDHGKNFSGKDRIKLCAKSFISQVYDLLASDKWEKQLGSFPLCLFEVPTAELSRVGRPFHHPIAMGARLLRAAVSGKKHHAAVRALAFKWIRIIYRCWKERVAYDENVYLAALAKHNSPLVAATKAEAL